MLAMEQLSYILFSDGQHIERETVLVLASADSRQGIPPMGPTNKKAQNKLKQINQR